jgi:hypothetical protein
MCCLQNVCYSELDLALVQIVSNRLVVECCWLVVADESPFLDLPWQPQSCRKIRRCYSQNVNVNDHTWPLDFTNLLNAHNQKSMRYRSIRLLLSRVRRVTRWLKGWFRYSIFSSELGTGIMGLMLLAASASNQMETHSEFLPMIPE